MVGCDNLKKNSEHIEKSLVSSAISSFFKFDNVRKKKSRLEHLNKNTLLHAVVSETQNALTKRNLAAETSRL